VRCPRHTIHFSGYGYSEYIREALKILGIDINALEWKEYESWTPYVSAKR